MRPIPPAITYLRGTYAKSKEAAIQTGFTQLNSPSGRSAPYDIKGGFFIYGGTKENVERNYIRDDAEVFAKLAQRRAETNGIPVVIELTVTKDNFDRILKERIIPQEINDGITHTARQVSTYEDLVASELMAAINLNGLSHEDFVDLGMVIGFGNDNGQFEYNEYRNWTEALGVRAKTREEMNGNNPEGGTVNHPRSRA